jgi:hypothetical protein
MLELAAGQKKLANGATDLDDGVGAFAPSRLALPVGIAFVVIALVMAAMRIRRTSQAGHAAD